MLIKIMQFLLKDIFFFIPILEFNLIILVFRSGIYFGFRAIRWTISQETERRLPGLESWFNYLLSCSI